MRPNTKPEPNSRLKINARRCSISSLLSARLMPALLCLLCLSLVQGCDDTDDDAQGGDPVVRAGDEAGSTGGDQIAGSEGGVMGGDQGGGVAGNQGGEMAGEVAGNTPPVLCGELPPVPQGECVFTPAEQGEARNLLIQGTILTADEALSNGSVMVDLSQPNGTLLCVGCDCEGMSDASTARLVCPDAVVSPGLINPHDHLGWATAQPVLPQNNERYEHRHDWRKGRRNHTRISAGGSDNSGSAILVGELRMLMSGASSIAGSSNTGGLLRNLDDARADAGPTAAGQRPAAGRSARAFSFWSGDLVDAPRHGPSSRRDRGAIRAGVDRLREVTRPGARHAKLKSCLGSSTRSTSRSNALQRASTQASTT